MALFVSRFKKDKPKNIKKINELCISIIDFRDSVLVSYKNDLLLEGFIDNAVCYHFDFDRAKDEGLFIDKNIYMYNASVHPDGVMTRMGMRKTAACIVEFGTFFKMLKTAADEDINIIRAHDPHLLGFNAFLLSRLTKTPFIVQICSNYEIKDRQAKGLTFRPFIFQGIERRFERGIMRASDLVLTDREHYRDFGLIPKDIPDSKYGNMGFFVSDIHYAPTSSRKDLRGELNIAPEKKIILYAGRLAEVKYPLDLMKMFAVCLKNRRDLMLVIAGDGVLRDEMENMAREGSFRDNVIFMEKLPQDKLADLYNTADVVCFTSAGFTMVEAALAEKCIVAYDFEWHSEFLGRDERGILVPFGDTGRFAEETLKVLEDGKLRERLGKAAREYGLANYSRDAAIRKEIGYYKRLFTARGYTIEKTV
jgi:glycosyltransferase involved in cell wall biosynthesis